MDKRFYMARWLVGHGIEIGALHNPLPVPAGTVVSYVDRLQPEGLRDHYPELAGDSLVPIDIVADAEDLSPIPDQSQDFVIACHLLEHLENPLRGLAEMARVLRPGGILYAALPDPRLTFDRDRELTPVEHVINEFHQGVEATREAHYVDWVERVEPIAGGIPSTGPQRVRDLMRTGYSIHFHVWRPENFIEVVQAARREANVALELLEFSPCRGGPDNEYVFIFGKETADRPARPPQDGESAASAPDIPIPAREAFAGQFGYVAELEARLRAQSETLEAWRALQVSPTYRLAARCQALVRRAAPPGTIRRRLTTTLARGLSAILGDRHNSSHR